MGGLTGVAFPSARVAAPTGRIDTAALKLAHPIEDVVARYGIELKRQGRALVGRCPFHADGGRPNLHVFTASQSWFCFRCGIGGDVVKFVMLAEQVGFLEAIERIAGSTIGPLQVAPERPSKPDPRMLGDRDPEEMAVLNAAVSLFRTICSPSRAHWSTSPVAASMRPPSHGAGSATHRVTSWPHF
jgi:hypothetical protein